MGGNKGVVVSGSGMTWIVVVIELDPFSKEVKLIGSKLSVLLPPTPPPFPCPMARPFCAHEYVEFGAGHDTSRLTVSPDRAHT